MNLLEQLRKRLTDLATKMEAAQKAADDAKRPLTAEEAKSIDDMSAEFDAVKADLDRREKLEARKAALESSNGRRTAGGMVGAAGGVRVIGERADGDPMSGFRDASDFALSVRNACRPGAGAVDDRLLRMAARSGGSGVMAAPSGYQTEGSGSDGGFMVPPQVRDSIWELVFNGDDLINRVTVEPTSSNAVDMQADETTPWGATGVKAKWRSEASQMVATGKVTTDPRIVKLQELYAFVLATDELLDDAPRLASRITQRAAMAIRWEASEAIMWGNGAGKPLGFMNGGSLVSVAKESGQAAATIVRQNLLKMLSRLLRMGGSAPLWIANSDVMPALGELTLGNNGLYFLPQTGFSQGPQATLLGVPIEFTEHSKTLGTQGDLVLADMSGYYAAQKTGGVKYDTSIHLFFDYGIQAFRWTFRIGGQPFMKSAMTPANGSNTKSHFVALADRA